MSTPNYKRTKFACYFAYVAGASVFCLPPLLFATFRELYGISYTLLGTLVLINFCTQLGIDLIFSFFSRYFNIRKTICLPIGIHPRGQIPYPVLTLPRFRSPHSILPFPTERGRRCVRAWISTSSPMRSAVSFTRAEMTFFN